MKMLATVMSIGLAIGVCQQALAQASVEKGKSVAIEIPVDSDTACNIEVTRGGEKTNVSVDPKSKKGVYQFAGRESGEETIRWEGKMKFRGLKTLGPCRGDGSIKVVTTESVEAIETAKQAQKAEQDAKQAKATMDAQAARLAELEAKLKAAEAEAAKTPEQKAKEARIAAEAKANAEAATKERAAAEAEAAANERAAADAKRGAAEWRSIMSNEKGQLFYDSTSMRGDSTDRKLSVKANVLGEAKDGAKSRLLQVSVNCTERTYLFESIKIFSESDLTGNERTLDLRNRPGKRNAQPNTIADRYVNIACAVNSSNTSSAISAAGSNQSNEPNQSKNKFRYFGKVNLDKDLKAAFSDVMTYEQKRDIAFRFIFPNNILLTLSKSSNYQEEAMSYAPLLPKMKEGVERYLRPFDVLASTLGISRSRVMKEFSIEMNDFGYAKYLGGGDTRSQEINYIHYYSGNRNLRYHAQNNLNPYYKERPPEVLFTSVINEDIKKIELIQQRVLDNAIRIENQLQANKNEKIRIEREATLRREAEEKRMAEERQKREDFLKSPEGLRQIAAERRAKELAEEMSRPKPIDRKRLLPGKEYTYSGGCTTEGNQVCLVPADYEYLCKLAKSMTQLAASRLTSLDNVASHLVTNGATDSIEVSWQGSSSSKYKCRATITVSGIYKGSSSRVTSYGGVSEFIVNNSNKVLVHNASTFK